MLITLFLVTLLAIPPSHEYSFTSKVSILPLLHGHTQITYSLKLIDEVCIICTSKNTCIQNNGVVPSTLVNTLIRDKVTHFAYSFTSGYFREEWGKSINNLPPGNKFNFINNPFKYNSTLDGTYFTVLFDNTSDLRNAHKNINHIW
jgi:hypothetical protein